MNRHIKWIMLVSGLITSTMFVAAVAPELVLSMMFGEALPDGPWEVIVRNWGALIGVVGLTLIYGAFHAEARRLALYVAVSTKTVFVILMVTVGSTYLPKMGASVAFDAVLVVVFVVYLVSQNEAEAVTLVN